mgnify:FL=1
MGFLISLLGYLSLIFFYWIFRDSEDKKTALAAVAFLAINNLFGLYSIRILTDIPFLFLSAFSLFFLCKYKNRQSFLNKEGFLTVIGLAALYLCRYIGVLLFLISLFSLLSGAAYFSRKMQFKKALFLASTYLPIFLFWNIRNLNIRNPYIASPANYELYLKLIAGKPELLFSRFMDGINFYFSVTAETAFTFFINKFRSPVFLNLFLIVITAVILTGLWREIMRKRGLFASYFVLYLILISLWPYREGEGGRYLIPILPFSLFYFILGLKKITNSLPKTMGFIYPLVISSIFVSQILLLPIKKYSLPEIPLPLRNFILLHKWIKTTLPPEGIIISRKPTVTYFFTNHKSAGYPFIPNPDEIWQGLSKHNAEYLIVDEFSRETYYYLSPLLYKYKDRLTLLYRRGDTGLFKIIR